MRRVDHDKAWVSDGSGEARPSSGVPLFSSRPLALCLALTACGTSEDDMFFAPDAEPDTTDTIDVELPPLADRCRTCTSIPSCSGTQVGSFFVTGASATARRTTATSRAAARLPWSWMEAASETRRRARMRRRHVAPTFLQHASLNRAASACSRSALARASAGSMTRARVSSMAACILESRAQPTLVEQAASGSSAPDRWCARWMLQPLRPTLKSSKRHCDERGWSFFAGMNPSNIESFVPVLEILLARVILRSIFSTWRQPSVGVQRPNPD